MHKFNIVIYTPKNSWMYEYSFKLKKHLENNSCSVVLEEQHNFDYHADFAFYLSYPYILGSEELTCNTHNIVVHASKLPQGKGWSPISWQILEGKNNIPITLFEANEQVDSGMIYLEDTLYLKGDELSLAWRRMLGKKIIEMCMVFLSDSDYYIKNAYPQNGAESFYRKRTLQDSELDVNLSLSEQFNLLRIVDNENYPAFFKINNKKYILKIYEEK